MKAVIFDLDNTLFNSTGQLYVQARRKACKAMAKAGIPSTQDKLYQDMLEFYQQYGPFFDVVIAQLLNKYGIIDEKKKEKIRAAAEEAYNSVNVSGITLYQGVYEMLERLKSHYKLALLTSGWPDQQNKKIEALGIRHFFDLIVFDNVSGETKSAKDSAIRQVLKAFDVVAEEVVCVGDRIDREIMAGNKLGLVTVRIMQGSYSILTPRDRFEEPTFSVHDVVEVEDIIESLESK